jgi:hypothetical protein
LVLEIFLAICTAGVVFFLRVLLALESEVSHSARRSVPPEGVWIHRVSCRNGVRVTEPSLILVHSVPGGARSARQQASGARLQVIEKPRAKEA